MNTLEASETCMNQIKHWIRITDKTWINSGCFWNMYEPKFTSVLSNNRYWMKMLDASEITYEPHFNSFNDWDYNLMLDASENMYEPH